MYVQRTKERKISFIEENAQLAKSSLEETGNPVYRGLLAEW